MSNVERLQAEAEAFRAAMTPGSVGRSPSGLRKPKGAMWLEEVSDDETDAARDAPAAPMTPEKDGEGMRGPDDTIAENAAADAEGGGDGVEDAVPSREVSIWTSCRSVEEFERLNMVDEGTFGTVFRARDQATGRIHALKQVKMEREREGFPLTSVREFNMLLALRHPNVVNVQEVVVGRKMDSVSLSAGHRSPLGSRVPDEK